MGRQTKTQQRLDAALEVLTEYHPMTVRHKHGHEVLYLCAD
jgi:hypothetical protein